MRNLQHDGCSVDDGVPGLWDADRRLGRRLPGRSQDAGPVAVADIVVDAGTDRPAAPDSHAGGLDRRSGSGRGLTATGADKSCFGAIRAGASCHRPDPSVQSRGHSQPASIRWRRVRH